MKQPRIVSLLSSATEIVSALGLDECLVGRSHTCDYPPYVQKLPVCTAPKFDPGKDSAETHHMVESIMQESLSVHKVYTEVIQSLQPDFIITQSQCEVCGVDFKNLEAAVKEMIGSHPKIIDLHPNNIEDVLNEFQKIADETGCNHRGDYLISHIRERFANIKETVKDEVPGKRVAMVEWIEPLMLSGYWTPELVEIAGGTNVITKPGEHAPKIIWQDIVNEDPDVIIVAPCGYDIQTTLDNLHYLQEKAEWKSLKAVQNQEIYIVDGNDYINRAGPRLVDSAWIIAEILYPHKFKNHYHQKGWIKFNETPDKAVL